ncbi:MAG TPA: hypothetical protein VM120_12670 [Bryobacteraceae bacterium]|nr:hypothetical protein [Bryobacteraceae bacterium]
MDRKNRRQHVGCHPQIRGRTILVNDGKVYIIENQDLADLQKHAGHTVKITGEMTGDTIVSFRQGCV